MSKNNIKKKITTEAMARMVAKGFEETATKQDLAGLATKQEMREGFQLIADRLDLMHSDIRDLKISVEVDIKDLYKRVERLEKRVGIAV